MIKSERTEDGTTVEIVGSGLDVSTEMHAIIETLAEKDETRPVLGLVVLSLSEFYAKEDMIDLVDRAYDTQKFIESPLGAIISAALDKIKENAEEVDYNDGTTTAD